MTIRNACLGVAVIGLTAIGFLESDEPFRPGVLTPSNGQVVITIALFLAPLLMSLFDFGRRGEKYFEYHRGYLALGFGGLLLALAIAAMMVYKGFYSPFWASNVGFAAMGFVMWLRTKPEREKLEHTAPSPPQFQV